MHNWIDGKWIHVPIVNQGIVDFVSFLPISMMSRLMSALFLSGQ